MAGGRQVVIGIDVGTTSTKAGAFTPDGAEVSTGTVATRLIRGGHGHVEQDPAELVRSAHGAVAECMARGRLRPDDVAAVAVTGQMAGVMGIDAAGEAVTPYDSWLDSRAGAQLERLAAAHNDLLVERTGCPPMMNHAPKMQWWREERPREYERIAAFVMPGVHVAMRLAGLDGGAAFIDPSYLHFTGAADARTGEWSPQMLSALELDGARMPRIVPSQTIVGELTPAAAAACGLAAGTPVAAGLGDTAAGVLGAGIVRPGQLLDTAGTAAVFIGSVDGFLSDPELMVMRGTLPAQHLPLNYVAGGGLCMPWLATLSGRSDENAIHDVIADADAVDPGADGLAFLPHVEGRMAPHDPSMRGGWLGLSFAHGRGHMARSMLEAIAFEYATYLRAMRRARPDVAFDEARAIGGGARSTVWNRIKADVLGVPVRRVAAEETATRGAALVAAAAIGAIDDMAEVAANVPLDVPVEPNAGRHRAYAPLVDRHGALVALIAEQRPLLTSVEGWSVR